MIGLTIFTVIGLWLAFSGWLAWWLARRAQLLWKRALIFVLAFPTLVMAPLGDEVIGLYQFNRYCENAKEVKIYGRIVVGEELYTADGKWRLQGIGTRPIEEWRHLNERISSYLHWSGRPKMPLIMPGAIPIHYYFKQIYDARNGRLLAEWHQFTNGGGWLKRISGIGAGTGGHLLPQVCAPAVVLEAGVERQLLIFSITEEQSK